MKKSEQIAAIMRNEGEVSPRNDPRVSGIIADIQQLLYSGEQVVLPGFASFSIAQDTRPEELKRRELTTIQRDQGEDAIEKQVETMDTYIPEPLRNADGTPIQVHATVNRVVRATDGASSAGMFAQKPAKQQDLSREELKMNGSEKVHR
jgi:nucleoid DNA-binding protein